MAILPVRVSIILLTFLLSCFISSINAVPATSSNQINSNHHALNLDSTVRTEVKSCKDWVSVYERYWNKFENCHQGESTTRCCELYDLMDKSIRIFQDGLQCVVTNLNFYSRKYDDFCKNGMATTTTTVSPVGIDNSPPVPVPDAVPAEGGHGSVQIIILNDGTAETQTVTHTSGGGYDCNQCGCTGCECANHCGGSYVPPQQPCNSCPAPAPAPCQTSCVGAAVGCVLCSTVNNQPAQTAPQQPAQASISIPRDNDRVCFHGDGTVLLQDGSNKLMKHLSVGDMVHIGKNQFSQVFMFTHRNAYIPARFVKIQVDDGRYLKLTSNHYIHTNKGLIQAQFVKIGDNMEMDDGKFVPVKSISRLFDMGLYNPQTMHGDIIVSGFKASTYTTYIKSQMAHSMLAPLRALYRISGLEISWLF